MCTRIVGEGFRVIYLAHCDVLYGTRREKVQRNQFVVGVGRGYGESVQGCGAVTVAQSAHNELACIGNGDARNLLYSFFHIADAFEAHLLRTEVLDGEGCFPAFHLQGAFALKVLSGHYRHFTQSLCVALQLKVQYEVGFAGFYVVYDDVLVAYIFNGQCISSVVYIQGVVTVHIGNGALCCSCYLYGGSGQRFPGLLVGDGAFNGACHDRHGRECEK